MNQPREKSASWITHAIEIAAAVGVLSAVVIPALVFPAMHSNPGAPVEDAVDYDFEAASASPSQSSDYAPRKRYQRPAPKSVPNVSPEFAINAIRSLAGRFDFARQMVIAQPQVTDADVVELVQLAQLGDVAPTTVRAEELVLWDWLINVEAIDLSASDQITDASVNEIAKLSSIKDLNLSNSLITDEGLAKLTELERLNFLNVSCTLVTNCGLHSLGRLHELEILEISSTHLGDDALAVIIDSNPKLQSLTLAETRITGASLRTMSKLTLLESLDLGSCRIDDASLDDLIEQRRLTSLVLANTQITDSGIESLVALDHLVELNLEGVNIGARAQLLLESALPDCSLTY